MHDSAELVVIASPSGVGRPARSPDTSPALPLSGAMLHLVGTPARPQGCRSPYPRAFASVDPGSGGSTGRATKALFRSRLSANADDARDQLQNVFCSSTRGMPRPNARQLPANLGCELVHVDGHALPHPIRRLHLRERGLACAKVCFALEQGKGHHAPAISIDEHRQPTAALDPGRRALGGVGSQSLGGGLDAVGCSALERLHSYEHCRPLLSSAPKATAARPYCPGFTDRGRSALVEKMA